MFYSLSYFCIVLTFMVPSSLLVYLGVPLGEDGGNVLMRIPPLTYIFVFSFMFTFLYREPFAPRRDLSVYYINAAIGCWWMLYGYLINKHPATIPLVSYIAPFLFLTFLVQTTDEERHKIGKFIHGYMFINSLIAIVEYFFHARLVPMSAGEPGSEVGRSAALFGHPLTAATVTGAYILAILSNFKTYKNVLWPALAIAVGLLAMATYGGRTAMGALALCGGLVLLKGEWMQSADGQKQMSRVFAMFAIAVISFIVLIVGYYAGFFNVFIDRIMDDHGSGYTRVLAWDTVWSSSMKELLFGRADKAIVYWNTDFNRIDALSPESFWLNLIFYNGFIVFLPLLGAYMLGFWKLSKEVSGHALYVLLYFTICITGAVGLGGKSQILAMIFTLVIVLYDTKKLREDENISGRVKAQKLYPQILGSKSV